jgi:NAD-dependent SIR2 family protein deacetylase
LTGLFANLRNQKKGDKMKSEVILCDGCGGKIEPHFVAFGFEANTELMLRYGFDTMMELKHIGKNSIHFHGID